MWGLLEVFVSSEGFQQVEGATRAYQELSLCSAELQRWLCSVPYAETGEEVQGGSWRERVKSGSGSVWCVVRETNWPLVAAWMLALPQGLCSWRQGKAMHFHEGSPLHPVSRDSLLY